MAIERVQSPFAANIRAIKRMERLEREAKRQRSRRERLEAEDRAIKRRQRVRQAAERSEARLRADNERRFRTDLRDSILRGRPVGLLRKTKPSINKVVINTRGGRPGKNVLGFEAQIDQGHLRQMAARSNALNLLMRGTKTADARAGAMLAPDFYPASFFTGVAAEPQMFGVQTMPEQITGGPYDPAGAIRRGEGVPPFQGQMPGQLDVTSQFQTPEFEEGPPSETKMSHIYKMLDMMQGRKKSPIEDKVEQLRASAERAGLGPQETEERVQRMLGGLEKTSRGRTDDLTDAALLNLFSGKMEPGAQGTLKELLAGIQGGQGLGAGLGQATRGAPAPPQITEAQVRRDFKQQFGVEPTSVEILEDEIIVMVGKERYVLDRGE